MWLRWLNFLLLIGSSAAAMLIFILPSAFYIKLVKKESMKSMQKIGVRIKRKSHVLDFFIFSSVQKKMLKIQNSQCKTFHYSRPPLSCYWASWSWSAAWASSSWTGSTMPAQRHTATDTKGPSVPEKGRLQRWTASERKKNKKKQPRSSPSVKDKNKHKNSHDAQLFDPLSCKTMPFRENVPELCTVPCHQPHRWCFTCIFFSFYCNFVVFFARFSFFFSFGFSLNSYGTAENNHSKVPQFRDGVVVDLKKAASAQVRRDSRTSAGCDLRARWLHRAPTSPRLTRGKRLETLSSSETLKFLPAFCYCFYFPPFFYYFAKNVFVKHLCILQKALNRLAHLGGKGRKKDFCQFSQERPSTLTIQYLYKRFCDPAFSVSFPS